MFKLLLLIAAAALLWAIVRLLLQGGVGSWRRALATMGHYVNLIAGLLLAGAAIGLAFAAADYFTSR